MLFQIILALAICVFLTYGAPLEEEKEKNGRRHGKTLGLVTAGAQSIAPIVATAGKGVVGLLAGVSAILPLAKLGLAKCKYCNKKNLNTQTVPHHPEVENNVKFPLHMECLVLF